MSRDNETDFEMNQELNDLAQALRENRPTPEPDFTERLDQAVADHFVGEWIDGVDLLLQRLRNRCGNEAIIPLDVEIGDTDTYTVHTTLTTSSFRAHFSRLAQT